MIIQQAAINAAMLPWNDVEIRRFKARVGLFTRRGQHPIRAEFLADRLALRDQQRDDRRCCIECAHLDQRGRCFAAAQGWLKNTSTRHEPVVDILQRCERFTWQKPQ